MIDVFNYAVDILYQLIKVQNIKTVMFNNRNGINYLIQLYGILPSEIIEDDYHVKLVVYDKSDIDELISDIKDVLYDYDIRIEKIINNIIHITATYGNNEGDFIVFHTTIIEGDGVKKRRIETLPLSMALTISKVQLELSRKQWKNDKSLLSRLRARKDTLRYNILNEYVNNISQYDDYDDM